MLAILLSQYIKNSYRELGVLQEPSRAGQTPLRRSSLNLRSGQALSKGYADAIRSVADTVPLLHSPLRVGSFAGCLDLPCATVSAESEDAFAYAGVTQTR